MRRKRRGLLSGALVALLGMTVVSLGVVAPASAAVVASGYTLTTLASFNGTNGANPWGDLSFDAAGTLLGSTFYGGSANAGSRFSPINPAVPTRATPPRNSRRPQPLVWYPSI